MVDFVPIYLFVYLIQLKIYMYYFLCFLLVILLDHENYISIAKATTPPTGRSSSEVAQISSWRSCTFPITTQGHLPALEQPSLQGPWIAEPASTSNGKHIPTTMEMLLVQKTQQAPHKQLWVLLCVVGENASTSITFMDRNLNQMGGHVPVPERSGINLQIGRIGAVRREDGPMLP